MKKHPEIILLLPDSCYITRIRELYLLFDRKEEGE